MEVTDAGLAPGPTPVRTVTVRVELARLTSHLQNVLQFELDAARLCLAGIDAGDSPILDASGSHFNLDPARNKKLPLDELREQARWWVQRNAFRNCVEALAPLLEFTRDVLAMWSMRGMVKREAYKARMGPERERYHWMGAKEKMKFLSKAYGFVIPQDWQGLVSSISKARNCLVHRAGRVEQVDCEDGALTVRWLRLGTFVERDGSHQSIGPGEWIDEGEQLVVARHPTKKAFPQGDIVRFSIGELNELCYTLLQFGNVLKRLLANRGHELGILPRPDATTA